MNECDKPVHDHSNCYLRAAAGTVKCEAEELD